MRRRRRVGDERRETRPQGVACSRVFGTVGTIGSRPSTAMAITVSDAGLGLYAFVFTALSIVVRGVFDACNVANLPPIAEAGLTREDCEQWSQSWIKNAPRGKESAAELLVLFFHVLVRIEQNFFLCSSIACWYALFKCTAVQRKPMHLFLALVPHRTRRLRASRSASAPPRSCSPTRRRRRS